jgi:hypothetical protein
MEQGRPVVEMKPESQAEPQADGGRFAAAVRRVSSVHRYRITQLKSPRAQSQFRKLRQSHALRRRCGLTLTELRANSNQFQGTR